MNWLVEQTYTEDIGSYASAGFVIMGIHVEWDNPEKTVIRQSFEGQWTGEEYLESVDEMAVLLKDVDYRVHLIGDMTDSVGIPTLNLLAVSGRVVKMVEQHFATVTFVRAHTYFQALVSVVRRMSPSLAERVCFVSCREETYQWLPKASQKVMPI